MIKQDFTSIDQADHVVVSVSGGKDSTYLLWWAIQNVPRHKLKAVHAVVDLDWAETPDQVKKQCSFFGLSVELVQAIDKDGNNKGIISKLLSPRIDRKTGETKQNMFPGPGTQWCTSEIKVAPIDKYIRTLQGNIAILIGERYEESDNRAKLNAWRPKNKISTKTRTVVNYSPILQITEKQVWEKIKELGAPVHPCYSREVSRCSCAVCIYSPDFEITVAAQYEPKLVQKYLEAEKQISHTFRYKKEKGLEIKQTIRQILEKALNFGWAKNYKNKKIPITEEAKKSIINLLELVPGQSGAPE